MRVRVKVRVRVKGRVRVRVRQAGVPAKLRQCLLLQVAAAWLGLGLG